MIKIQQCIEEAGKWKMKSNEGNLGNRIVINFGTLQELL